MLSPDPRFRPAHVPSRLDGKPFLEHIYFDSDHRTEDGRFEKMFTRTLSMPREGRVWKNEMAISAIGVMSDEAERIQFLIGGKIEFETDIAYLNRAFPQLYKLKLGLLLTRTDEVKVVIFSPNENPRAFVVLSGAFLESR